MFSVVNAVLLRPLRFENSDRLVRLFHLSTTTGEKSGRLAYPTLADVRDQSRSYDEIGGFRYWVATMSGKDLPESFLAVYVTERFPRTLRVSLARGRWFQDGSDTPAKVSEVVLSDAVWRTRFGADPGAVGSTVTVEGRPATIVGVLPANFRFPDLVPDNVSIPSREPAIYLPAGLEPGGIRQSG